MVIPLGPDSVQTMTVIRKVSENDIEKTQHGSFRFVPMLKDKAK